MGDSKDKELGMRRDITRRDFLNGIAITSGLAMLPPHLLAALQNDLDPEKSPNYYPPSLTGLRGSHIGSFEVAHSLRDGDFWQKAGTPIDTGEKFDLIVVGGGISGLSAAYFFRKSNPNARILILENHDDFGGHAKRNEFTVVDPRLSSDQKKDRLARISYAKFLTDIAHIDQEIVKLYQAAPHGLFGVGIDSVSAQDAWGLGLPGFSGMKLEPGPGKGMNRDAIPNAEAEKYFFHFPDGNASIARMLVRKLIPHVIGGNSATDIISQKADYAKIDDSSSPIRIRLNSTVVRVKHVGDPATAKEVEITYSRFGKLYTARAPYTVLACWNMVVPYIATELPEHQKNALNSAAKVPLLYTNVVIRNWTSFQKLGTSSVYAPGCYHSAFTLDLPVSIGEYQCSKSPDQPIVIHMMKTPCKPGLPARDQHRMGRIELFMTEFETMERQIRDQLARALGPGGFDPARDIAAITVNRWPHCYAYEYN